MAHIKKILNKKKTFEYREADTEGERWPCKDRDLKQLQAKECQGLMATVRSWKTKEAISSRDFGGSMAPWHLDF